MKTTKTKNNFFYIFQRLKSNKKFYKKKGHVLGKWLASEAHTIEEVMNP